MKKFLLLFVVLLAFQFAKAQTDTTFWFVAPRITTAHTPWPISFKMMSFHDEPVTVRLSKPADPTFTPRTEIIPANGDVVLEYSKGRVIQAELDLFENKPAGQVNKHGVLIEADKVINVYYEISTSKNNPEIFSLKGKNALGIDFIVPGQTEYVGASYSPLPWNTADIVATEDGTVVTIKTPVALQGGHAANSEFTINLNKGETYACASVARLPANHIHGMTIKSNKPIAVTVTDDSVGLRDGFDLIGDQIVPTNIVGTEYIAIRGNLTSNADTNSGGSTHSENERLYIFATEPGTTVTASNQGIFGTPMAVPFNGRDPLVVAFRNTPKDEVVYIKATKPVYVFQLTGDGVEFGSALLPPITCTGSRKIKYKRGSTGTMRLNICVPDGGEANFMLDGNPNIITAAQFKNVPNSALQSPTGWKYVSLDLSTTIFPFNSTKTIECTTPFHIGVFEAPSGGCNYGYFSDYGLMTDLTPISAKADNTFCAGGELVLELEDVLNLKNIEWSHPDGWRAYGAKVKRTNLQLSHSGVYTVKAEHNNGCEVTPASIEIFVTRAVSSFEATDVDCVTHEKGKATVTVSEGIAPYKITWASTNSTTIPADDDFSPTGLEAGTYHYTVTDARGCTDLKSFDIAPEVVYSPNPLVDPDLSVCAGTDVEFSAQYYAGVSYNWSGPNNFSATTLSSSIDDVQIENGGTYSVTVTDINGCSGVGDVTLIVFPGVDIEIEGETLYCQGSTIDLLATQGYDHYSWVGPNYALDGNDRVQRGPALQEMSGTYTVTVTSVNGCTAVASTTIAVEQSLNINFLNPAKVCTGTDAITLNASPSGGTWTIDPSTPTAGIGAIVDNRFYPKSAGAGTFKINYYVKDGDCEATEQTTLEVGNTIAVKDFKVVCDPSGGSYKVSFKVTDVQGITFRPFEVSTDGHTYTEYDVTTFEATFNNNESYYFVIRAPGEDFCPSITYSGTRDCGCVPFAGTMSDNDMVRFCENECTDSKISHNKDHICTTNCEFEFILYEGSPGNPTSIIARSDNPDFCFDSDLLSLNTQYFISAIAGPPGADGHPDPTAQCYSISNSTPVMWLAGPEAIIVSTFPGAICGNEVTLQADLSGQANTTGYWSKAGNQSFDFTIIEGNYDSETIKAVVKDYQSSKVFMWTATNGVCSDSAKVTVTFLEVPVAYAGRDTVFCGKSGSLNAKRNSTIPSNGEWTCESENISFGEITNPKSSITASDHGTYLIKWTETRAGSSCASEHKINVTFMEKPNPFVPNGGIVSGCGVECELEVIDDIGIGEWVAYENNVIMVPQPNFLSGKDAKKTIVRINTYSTPSKVIKFVWETEKVYNNHICTNSADVMATFYRVPQANINVASKKKEVCGNCVDLSATAVNGTLGTWSMRAGFTEGSFDDPHATDVTFCNNAAGLYGNSGRDSLQLIWTVSNEDKCVAKDSVMVYFHQRPTPNAGPDASICGNKYTLYASYGIPESENYSHKKEAVKWYAKELGAEFKPFSGDPDIGMNIQNVTVTIPATENRKVWRFYFEEKNAYIDNCEATDSVDIEFIKTPSVSVDVADGYSSLICGTETFIEATVSGDYQGAWSIVSLSEGVDGADLASPDNQLTKVTSLTPGSFLATWTSTNPSADWTVQCESKAGIQLDFVTTPTPRLDMSLRELDVCGKEYSPLRAIPPATGNKGIWESVQIGATIENATEYNNGKAIVEDFRTYEFYWKESVDDDRFPVGGKCQGYSDTVKITFLKQPTAVAGIDTLFCSKEGVIKAQKPTDGEGKWTTNDSGISFSNPDSPETKVSSTINNNDNNPFTVTWTVSNTEKCVASDQIKLIFAALPSSEVTVIPPKCIGETATLIAKDTTLNAYEWNFKGGIVDQELTDKFFPQKDTVDGRHGYFVSWPTSALQYTVELKTKQMHKIGGSCTSLAGGGVVEDPEIPGWENELIVHDECNAGIGQIKFELASTGADVRFEWNSDIEAADAEGNPIVKGDRIDRNGVFGLRKGDYGINASYRSPNNADYGSFYLEYYNDVNCLTDIERTIKNLGEGLKASFDISPNSSWELIPPATTITLQNNSIYDGLKGKVNCEWHLGDGNDKNVIRNNCNANVELNYEGLDPGCYYPKLVLKHKIYGTDCRSSYDATQCIQLDNSSSLEVPNVFTPNNDGINDFFQVTAESLETFKGVIQNRWGRVVFEWSDWETPEGGWDGKINGNSEASPGVYYYVIKAIGRDGIEHNKEGFLHLIREK